MYKSAGKFVGKLWESFAQVGGKDVWWEIVGKSWGFPRGGGKVLQGDLHMVKQR